MVPSPGDVLRVERRQIIIREVRAKPSLANQIQHSIQSSLIPSRGQTHVYLSTPVLASPRILLPVRKPRPADELDAT